MTPATITIAIAPSNGLGDVRAGLFVTAAPGNTTQTGLLRGLWLDSLMRRLINALDGGARPTWIILDGLTSLQHLTQLPAAIAEAHKANVRLVLGLHEFGQMEVLYGSTQADTILSGPLTKIFLRTSESRAAQWVSRTIGGMEIERWEEGSKGNVGQRSSEIGKADSMISSGRPVPSCHPW